MRKLAALFASITVSILILELGTPIVYSWLRETPFSADQLRLKLFQTEPSAAVAPTPESPIYIADKTLHPYLGYAADTTDARINRFGLLGPNPLDPKPPDTVVVGIFGGSVALAFADASEWLIAALHEYPEFADTRFHVLSLSLDGYKQPQQLMLLSYLLSLGVDLDIVINLDGYNEIALPLVENLPAGIYPFYPRSWTLFSRKGFDRDLALEFASIQRTIESRESWRRAMSRLPFRRSAFGLALWERIDGRLEAEQQEADARLRQKLNDGGRDLQTSGPFSPFKSARDLFRRSAEVWAASSKQMAALCGANEIQYFHFLQPNQYNEGTKTFTDAEVRIALEKTQPGIESDRAVRGGYPLLRRQGALLKREGVPFFDLGMVFRDTPESVYIDPCCHVNDLGNRIMANEIAATIAAAQIPEDAASSPR